MFDSTRRLIVEYSQLSTSSLQEEQKGRGPIKLQGPRYYLFFTASGEKTSPPPGGDVFSSEEEVCFRRVDT
jgi:hypothetical protein